LGEVTAAFGIVYRGYRDRTYYGMGGKLFSKLGFVFWKWFVYFRISFVPIGTLFSDNLLGVGEGGTRDKIRKAMVGLIKWVLFIIVWLFLIFCSRSRG
jgi:hypothetical protein